MAKKKTFVQCYEIPHLVLSRSHLSARPLLLCPDFYNLKFRLNFAKFQLDFILVLSLNLPSGLCLTYFKMLIVLCNDVN